MTMRAKVLLFFLIVVFGILGCLLFDRREPVTLVFSEEYCRDQYDSPEQCRGNITPYFVKPPQRASITWPVVEHRACEGMYTRRIRENADTPGGKVHVFDPQPVTYSELITADRKRFSKEFNVPKSVSPGPAVYFTVGARWCNFMQRIFWPIAFKSPEIPFYVLPDR